MDGLYYNRDRDVLTLAIETVAQTERDFGMQSNMSSFGTELFADNIEAFRCILDHADTDKVQKEKSGMYALLSITLVLIAYCSLKEDVTPGLGFGMFSLLSAFRRAVADGQSIEEQSAWDEYLSEIDSTYKHCIQAMCSCILCMISTKSNVDPHAKEQALSRARQEFVLATFAGQTCRGHGMVHGDFAFKFKRGNDIVLKNAISVWNYASVQGWQEYSSARHTAIGYIPERGIAPCAQCLMQWSLNASVYAVFAAVAGTYCFRAKNQRKSFGDTVLVCRAPPGLHTSVARNPARIQSKVSKKKGSRAAKSLRAIVKEKGIVIIGGIKAG